jgi:hypothetical protein
MMTSRDGLTLSLGISDGAQSVPSKPSGHRSRHVAYQNRDTTRRILSKLREAHASSSSHERRV